MISSTALNSSIEEEKSSENLWAQVSKATKKQIQWYLILAILLSHYNITVWLFPITHLFLPAQYQTLYSSFSAIFLNLYFVFYLQKVFPFDKGKLSWLSGRIGPRFHRKNIVLVYIVPLFLLGIIVRPEGLPVYILVNSGFLVVTVIFIRSMVHKTLDHFVRQKTIHLEHNAQRKTKAAMVLVHELKTPIMLSQNYIEDYEKKYGSNRDLEIIKSVTNKMARDVVNFSDLEKVNNDTDFYENERIVDFSETLTISVRLFSSLAARKNITISREIESGLLVRCDPGAIDRVINNLIDNAIKYTEENKSIWVKLASDGPGTIVFMVSDEGIGIPDGKQDIAFDFYQQVHNTRQQPAGMGMGLSIVKRIVQALNGKISMESRPGMGTTFTIILFRHFLSDKEAVSGPVISNRSYTGTPVIAEDIDDIIISRERPSIMVVEDNLSLLKLLRDKLSRYYNVYVGRNGTHALQKLEQGVRIDLLVSDIMMDNMDGFELCRRITEQKKFSHLPFIFLTASTEARTRVHGLRTGAVGYIEKPFRIKVLKEKIDAILALMERQRAALITQAYFNLTRETSLSPTDYFDANCDKYRFTSREKEISKLLKQGITYPAIGEELYIATSTVKKHVSHIFEKAGVKNKLQLIKVLEGKIIS